MINYKPSIVYVGVGGVRMADEFILQSNWFEIWIDFIEQDSNIHGRFYTSRFCRILCKMSY